MLNACRLYLQYVAISIRGQLQYRVSLAMMATGQLVTTGLEFFAIWALFERFGNISGWTLPEVAVLYGMANVAFAMAEAAGRGFDVFSDMVRSGDFDRLLLRPRGTAFQVAAMEFHVMRVGRLTQGLAVLGYGALAVDASWSPADATLLVSAILGGACMFVGVFVLQATLAFWTIESLEIVNTVTYGGVETTQYPLAIYPRALQRFFTYVIPLAFVGYVPALTLLERQETYGPRWLAWVSPLVGPAFLVVCLQVWRFGVRRYRSTGS